MNVLSFEKIIYNFDRVKELYNSGKTFPIHAVVSLTNGCNHRCIWCSAYEYQQSKFKTINGDLLASRIVEARQNGLKAITYVGNGEPTVHPDFAMIAQKIGATGIEQGIFTNGYLLDRHEDLMLDYFLWLRVSLDAGDEETHSRTHGVSGHFDKILQNISRLVSNRKGDFPSIGIQFGVHQTNIHKLYDSAKIVHDIGVDYFSIKPIFDIGAVGARGERNKLDSQKVQEEAQRVKELESDVFSVFYRPYQMKLVETKKVQHSFTRCYAGHFSVTVWEDGRVSVCGPFKVMAGNINEQRLSDICLSEETAGTIKNLDISKCNKGCRYLPLNELVQNLKDADKKFHVNFI